MCHLFWHLFISGRGTSSPPCRRRPPRWWRSGRTCTPIPAGNNIHVLQIKTAENFVPCEHVPNFWVLVGCLLILGKASETLCYTLYSWQWYSITRDEHLRSSKITKKCLGSQKKPNKVIYYIKFLQKKVVLPVTIACILVLLHCISLSKFGSNKSDKLCEKHFEVRWIKKFFPCGRSRRRCHSSTAGTPLEATFTVLPLSQD